MKCEKRETGACRYNPDIHLKGVVTGDLIGFPSRVPELRRRIGVRSCNRTQTLAGTGLDDELVLLHWTR